MICKGRPLCLPWAAKWSRPYKNTIVTTLKKIQKAWEWRKSYVSKNKLEAFRLLNGAGDDLEGLQVEYYLGAFQIIYKSASWFERRKELIQDLSRISGEIDPSKELRFFEAVNFSPLPTSATRQKGEGGIWNQVVQEGEFKFEIHLGEGIHSGLFLDQRENRKTIYFNSKNRRVLNLFSYTGAFTIAAMKGGAKEVVSVDLSKNYLDWLKRNVDLNHFDVKKTPVWTRDVFEYLKFAEKKNEKFDLIIIDPPTFSRSARGSFSTEKDMSSLLKQALSLLSEKGNIFFCINTVKISRELFQQKVSDVLKDTPYQILKPLSVSRDFKLTASEEKNPYLKACWIGV